MNRRARLGQLITASSTDHKQHRLRDSLEPLEERMMLTALTWTIDQAQSDVTIAIPDQPFEIVSGEDTYSGTLKIRNQGGSDGGPWNVGNSAEIAGTIATDYFDGSSIEFLLGQSNISGVNSGSYIPNPANWDGDDFNGSLAPGPGVFGGRLYPSVDQVFGLSVTVGHFNFADVLFDVGSAALSISSGNFAANTTDVGIGSAMANLKGTAVLPPLVGQILPDTQVTVLDLLTTNQAATGTITSPDPINQPNLRQLTFPIVQNFSLELSPETPPFTGSISGQIVATATLPPPVDSSVVTDRRLYYNNSAYDGNTVGAVSAAQEYSALATDKSAYLPGSGSFIAANTSSFSKGITGAIVELTGTHGTLTADDFTVRMSGQQLAANNVPSSWIAAPAPTVTVFSDTPVAGTDRVHLTWADGAIADRYLEIIVEGNDAAGGNNTNTGLATSDIHLYANKIGDDFTGSPTFSNTNATDELNARNSQGTADLAATNAYDFNRDFFVNSTDQLVARNNQGFLQWFSFSNPPAAPAPPGGDEDGSVVTAALAAAPSNTDDAHAASSAVASALTIPSLRELSRSASSSAATRPTADTSRAVNTGGSQAPPAVNVRLARANGKAADAAVKDLDLVEDLLESLLRDVRRAD
jgi:hypothetical protein